MADESQPARRAVTGDDSTQLRQRRTNQSPNKSAEIPAPGLRRRSSNFSDYSLSEARRSFQSSRDDILLPRPEAMGVQTSQDSTAWHSAPLAFALLPAVAGLLFKNGSAVVTDVTLLSLAAIFLNWSVRLPWDWYHSAQSIRIEGEATGEAADSENDDDNALSFSQTTLDEVPEDAPAPSSSSKTSGRRPDHEAATKALYRHELLALLSCFLFPLLGAYLLHTIRSQLSRPSEGLVSNFNLVIFLLASELRPMAHLAKLVLSRTLHLQRVVNSNPHKGRNETPTGDIKDFVRRLEELETRNLNGESLGSGPMEPALNGKMSALLTTEVRRTLQPELDALNRAVRRYEKRSTLQAFQTDSRLRDLEARLSDAISLAAAAANNERRQRGFGGAVAEWMAAAILLPLQALGALLSLPFKTAAVLLGLGTASVPAREATQADLKDLGGKSSSSSRGADRVRGRVGKR